MSAIEAQRLGLDYEHARIREDVLRMGSLVESCVTWVTSDDRRGMQGQLLEANRRAGHLLKRIERHGLSTLATQHPAARDLRRIIAAMHIAHELEQAAEHCREIGQLLGSGERIPEMHMLLRMQDHLANMLHGSMDAYVREDERLAVEIAARDDALDEAKAEIVRAVLSSEKSRTSAGQVMRSYWSAHHFERIGDRVVNICERIIFQTTGRLVDASIPALRRP